MACLRNPAIRDTHVHHLSAVRRAVYILLADQEALPPALVAELEAYKGTLDALYLEAADGLMLLVGGQDPGRVTSVPSLDRVERLPGAPHWGPSRRG
jgi:hypothetical protein